MNMAGMMEGEWWAMGQRVDGRSNVRQSSCCAISASFCEGGVQFDAIRGTHVPSSRE